ncbi:MAG: glycosyl transferase, partial [Candidatus Eremiobacteraeota bacterium]|nr:glycosyl transferase [Candidatus Eremiobacteraeota bacterium]
MTRTLPTLEHLIALSDDTGIIQHAVEDVPNRSTGYCTDDVSRAFMVALAKLEIEPRSMAARRLASTYLSFLHDAQMEDGRFHNFMSYDRKWLDEVGTQDSFG